MRIARRRAAARNWLAATLVVLALAPCSAFAEGGQNLILPLVTAIAVASAASRAPQRVATLEPGHRPLLSLIPKQVQFPDGYEIDVNDYIGPRRPVALVDGDRIASFDLLQHPQRGWMPSFTYDIENRGRLARTGEVLRFVLERRF
jgi:hypothetical protein